MRGVLAWLMALCLLVSAMPLASAAEEKTVFSMAGYDTEESKHVWDDNLFFQRMATLTGIEFSFREFTDAEEWKTYKAGLKKDGELPDVLFKADLSQTEIQSLYDSGVLIDLREYLPNYAPNLSALLNAHPDWARAITQPDGAIVALPLINELPSENALWINTAWLSRLKLDVPETADDFAEVLRAFRNGDPNRNGRSDEIPLTFTGLWDLKFLAHAFGMTPNDYGIEVRDGKAVFDYTLPAYRDFLAWLHMLYEERLLDRQGFLSLDTTRAITDSNAAITFGCVFGPTPMTMLPAAALPDYHILVLSSEGRKVYRELLGAITRGTFAVTSACSDPGKLLTWVDYLYTREGCFLATAGQLHDEYEVTSDGYWYWVDDIQTVHDSVLVDSTMSEGTPMPMYMDADYQLMFDDETTRKAIEGLRELQEVTQLPYPLLVMTSAQKQEIAEIWNQLGAWAEVQMTRFVTGDMELTDEAWEQFVQEAQTRGSEKLAGVFQNMLEQ